MRCVRCACTFLSCQCPTGPASELLSVPTPVPVPCLEMALQPNEDACVAGCGCRLLRCGTGGDPAIEFCALHSAADKLLAALEGILKVANVRIDDPRIEQFDAARAAVANAKGHRHG